MTGGGVILVVLDGLGDACARREMGYLEGLVEVGRARRWTLRAVLPSLSRPAYASVLTGLPPADHGITANAAARTLNVPHVFSLAAKAGLVTGAVAYAWIHELCVSAPFDPLADGEYDGRAGAVHHGRFYQADDFPDREVFWQAARMIERARPQIMLVHPMGCDVHGHRHGGTSLPYRRAAAAQDELLGQFVPLWQAQGFRVLVTADHGMDDEGHHGGTAEAARLVPCYDLAPDAGPSSPDLQEQTALAPTVLRLLGLPVPPGMTTPPLG
ncbi:alkaline phosphatase family protein [Pararhodospirillum photometricum]|uniref:Type I phosphodiesterase/nucleotide pyrophosphatase n=1 Tax=Pararhodospirillum photometricum DSM 122 TaxID=1150469 RepID=H6SPE3_PARPM|nr:alkaline phosphatase family protein [Pararhodospirillum photometricum]CCG09468.1 Putative uncharacterized protein [Pararhodospirillum photometricum DSM 122]